MTKISLFLGLLMTVCNCSLSAAATSAPAPTPGITMTQEEIRFVELANKERVERGLKQLKIDPLLVKIARAHSLEMAEKHYFAHDSPTPGLKTALDRYLAMADRRPAWALVGENLFYCSIVGADRGHTALMNSEGHRKNILESRFDRIGVGAYIDSRGEFYVTQMFLSKID